MTALALTVIDLTSTVPDAMVIVDEDGTITVK